MPGAAPPPRPFELHVPDDELQRLQELLRLSCDRLPRELPAAAPWKQGVSRAYLEEVVTHWRTRYDWRGAEERINRLSHFHLDVDSMNVHFIHEVRSAPVIAEFFPPRVSVRRMCARGLLSFIVPVLVWHVLHRAP